MGEGSCVIFPSPTSFCSTIPLRCRLDLAMSTLKAKVVGPWKASSLADESDLKERWQFEGCGMASDRCALAEEELFAKVWTVSDRNAICSCIAFIWSNNRWKFLLGFLAYIRPLGKSKLTVDRPRCLDEDCRHRRSQSAGGHIAGMASPHCI